MSSAHCACRPRSDATTTTPSSPTSASCPPSGGNGYINEILAQGTRILAAQDVPRIRASTDLGNVPMAEAFTRAGWVNFQRSVSMTWPSG